MDKVPAYVSLVFTLTTIATFGFILYGLSQAEGRKKFKIALISGGIILSWILLISLLAINEYFFEFESIPPRLFLVISPPTILIITLLSVARTRSFLVKIPIATLTYLHIIRIPIEIVLWWLFLAGLLPELLTFEGINYDILSGVTAPFIAIFAVGIKKKRRVIAFVWNLLALGLLFNIVGHAILSAPTPFQQFGFDVPNIGVFYFPFIWLPAFVVPAVLFSHLVSLVKLLGKKEDLK